MTAAGEVSNLDKPTMASLAKAISGGSLRGARGNSGVILSQLFRGFCKDISDKEVLYVLDLASAFSRAVDTAYKAVMKPKEGTILTVARAAADKALELSDSVDNLYEYCDAIIKEAEEVLLKTPDMLPVLKQAGVVDSGGQGLVRVLRGGCDFLSGKEIDLTFESDEEKAENDRLIASIEAWQNEPDSADSLKTLPRLKKEDADVEPEWTDTVIRDCGGVRVMTHKLNCNGVVHLRAYFALTDYSLEELTKLSQLVGLIGRLPTAKHDAFSLQQEIKRWTGSVGFGIVARAEKGQGETCTPYMTASVSALEESREKA
jgi:hypothetical protein